MRTALAFILISIALIVFVCTPLFAQQRYQGGNNMDIYRGILKDYNHPSQRKRFDDAQLEAPVIDVDEIVRREEAEKRRRQEQQRRAQQPSIQDTCQPGAMIHPYGCGIYGIEPCYCQKKGQALPGMR